VHRGFLEAIFYKLVDFIINIKENNMENGAKGECVYSVQRSDLASEVGISKEDDFPEVLATSRMIALTELSAARLMKSLLKPGELSVGVGVDMKHFAPTPVGEEVTAVSTFVGMDGKLYCFDVEVFDRAGKIAAGKHTRAIVKTERIMEGARSRMEKAEAQ
jgi:fluoroacetyl-CoA thioesterase